MLAGGRGVSALVDRHYHALHYVLLRPPGAILVHVLIRLVHRLSVFYRPHNQLVHSLLRR